MSRIAFKDTTVGTYCFFSQCIELHADKFVLKAEEASKIIQTDDPFSLGVKKI